MNKGEPAISRGPTIEMHPRFLTSLQCPLLRCVRDWHNATVRGNAAPGRFRSEADIDCAEREICSAASKIKAGAHNEMMQTSRPAD
jgi:hypothetical protein